jgi:hypothetical protein
MYNKPDPSPASRLSRRRFVGLTGAATIAAGAGTTFARASAAPVARSSLAGSTRTVFTDSFGAIPGWDRQGVVMSQSLPWETSLLQAWSTAWAAVLRSSSGTARCTPSATPPARTVRHGRR